MKHRSISIRWKVALLMLVTCSVTLVSSVSLQVFTHWKDAEAAQERSIRVAAETVGRDCASALLFSDEAYATRALGALSHEVSALDATVLDANHEVFAAWSSDELAPRTPIMKFVEDEYLEDGVLVISRKIQEGEATVGWIVVRSDMEAVRKGVIEGASRAIFLSLLCLGLSTLLALSLSRWIASPITHLTRKIRAVETLGDFSLRAKRHSNDELGVLVDSFNRMLARIEERDFELNRHKGQLEAEVSKRTLELVSANGELVTARDAAEAAARSKADFLANMSHEIRTPMNGVIGMTGLLLDMQVPDDQRDMLLTIRNCGDQLLTLINDILDFSKIESGKMALEEIDFNLREVIEDLGDIFGRRYQEKGVELHCLVQSTLPVRLTGDPSRLRQILTNLLGNALKFTTEGEVRLEVEVERQANGEVDLALSVSDSGIGIPADRIDSLFEAFTQVDASTTRRFGGTGLGLSISWTLAKLMGGGITVESVMGEGSTFTLHLPFGMQAEAREAFPVEEEVLRGMLVAILDDNETNRVILTHQLESWGCHVTCYSAPKAAVEGMRAKKEPVPALVLLDYCMDGMNGLEVSSALRAEEHLHDVPILLLTSVSFAGSMQKLEEAGASGQLTKPVKQSQLKKQILRILGVQLVKGAERAPEVILGDLSQKAEAGRFRILLVEDNAVNQRIGVALLERGGYQCEIANNGQEALDTLAKLPFDLILMDCQMPVLDGYGATRAIRQRETRSGEHIPVIAMTANAMEGDRERCLAAGMDDYLTKPVVSDQLYAKLSSWLRPGLDADKSA